MATTMKTVTTTSSSSSALLSSIQESITSYDVQRQALEQEATAITSELTSPTGDDGTGPPMGIDTPLVDRDGYPRGDIDLYRTRTLRKRLAEIRTDHKRIMEQIEIQLKQLALYNNNNNNQETIPSVDMGTAEQEARRRPKPKPKFDPVSKKWVVMNWDGTIAGSDQTNDTRLFDSIGGGSDDNSSNNNNNNTTVATTATVNAVENSSEQVASSQDSIDVSSLQPFARVDAVAERSPAQAAGLKVGDFILRFGNDITSTNSVDPFSDVAQLVPQAAGQQTSIAIVVKRTMQQNNNDESAPLNNGGGGATTTTTIITVHLRPRPWEGRGLLGCHIVPCTVE